MRATRAIREEMERLVACRTTSTREVCLAASDKNAAKVIAYLETWMRVGPKVRAHKRGMPCTHVQDPHNRGPHRRQRKHHDDGAAELAAYAST